jgi:hypothetical protein
MIGSPRTARNVLDYLAYIETICKVHDLCDTTTTALSVMPAFLKNRAAATRGSYLSPGALEEQR